MIDDTMMTPIDYSIIYYGTVDKETPLSAFKNVSTSDNTTTIFILSGLVDPGNYTVGVAVVNSAGRGNVKFYENVLGVYPITAHNIIERNCCRYFIAGVKSIGHGYQRH